MAAALEFGDGFLEVREGRLGQAAEVDDVGAVGGVLARAADDGLDGQARRVDDLGENFHRIAREVAALRFLAEVLGQVGELLGAAPHRQPQLGGERLEVAAAAPRHHDPVETARLGEAAADQLGGHQRRHLQAELAHLPLEAAGREALERGAQGRLGQAAGQEEDALHAPSHSAMRARSAAASSAGLATTVVASKPRRRSLLSRSMRRG